MSTEVDDNYAAAMAHPIGTIATVEGRTAVLIGKSKGPRAWHWMNGDWTSIPLGRVNALGHVDDHPTPTPSHATDAQAKEDT